MDALHLERYEYKYCVPEDRTAEIRRFIRPYTRPDANALGSPDLRYTIHNLYLDTPALDFYAACLNGELDRTKLRVRWYDDSAKGPLFTELKRRIRSVIVKDRARLSRDGLRAVLQGGPLPLPDGPERDNLVRFLDRAASTGARPAIHLRYTREPYESVFGDYARLTLDRAICFQPADGWDLAPDPRGWTYVDGAETTGGRRCSAVLELKFTREFPRWMSDLVGSFDLERTGYSKYVSSLDRRMETRRGGRDFQRHAASWR